MAMVCPRCNNSFDQRIQCPTCGVRLIYRHTSGTGRAPDENGRWQQTPWSRILVGLLLAQGLYYGLRHLCTAGLLVTGDPSAPNVWTTLYGLLFLQGLQALGLLVGGALAGAGKRQGIIYGAIVGIWNGVISVLVMPDRSNTLTAVTIYGQPILQMAFGAVGGLVGMLIWRPLPRLSIPGIPRPSVPLPALPRGPSVFSGPIAWGRVLAGVAVAVGGSIWANVILEMVLEASEGKLTISSHLQAQLVTWEITTLAILVGSALAGATKANGLKQGLCVGLGATVVMIGIRLNNGAASVDTLVYTAATTLAVSLLGGWFGGSLFPPVVHRQRLATI
ncbi:MAG TPA: hypothetical protein VNK04_24570 [Gemmataceae bacterium]|nr:hypothetical protein [Gemmataceae bacterium]